MECREYTKQKNDLYKHFLCFVDEEIQIDYHFEEFIAIIQKHKYEENPEEFKMILYLTSELSKNHRRSHSFLDKIEKIISHYSEYLKINFTKLELFKIFKKNPQILHYLFITNIIPIDDDIIKLLFKEPNQTFVIRKYKEEKMPDFESKRRNYETKRSITQNYIYYFYIDIQPILGEEEKEMIEKELFE